jgi:hypothetical protein
MVIAAPFDNSFTIPRPCKKWLGKGNCWRMRGRFAVWVGRIAAGKILSNEHPQRLEAWRR